MSARVALQRLEPVGHIELPAPRPCAAGARGSKRWKGPSHPQGVKCSLAELGCIRVVEVSAERTPALSEQWTRPIGCYHYLGYVPAVCRQKRYLVVSERHAVVAAAWFSAAAWRCAPRDRWFGCVYAGLGGNCSGFLVPGGRVKSISRPHLGPLGSRVQRGLKQILVWGGLAHNVSVSVKGCYPLLPKEEGRPPFRGSALFVRQD